MKKSIALLLLLTPLWVHGAPKPKELLKEVNSNKAQRLADYNSVFLQKTLYFSRRHRIVKANTKLLLEEDEFTITPFDDVESLHVITEPSKTQQRQGDMFHFKAHVVMDSDTPFAQMFPNFSFLIGAYAWDLNESGEALTSISNRFTHSTYWNIDEFGSPVLETPPDGVSAIAGPPPESPEDIERHKRLKKLKKHQFFSVSATFYSLDGKKYMLMPLKYTPKYSVIHEINTTELSFMRFEADPDGLDHRSDEDKMKSTRHKNFLKTLPDEEGKIVKGDIQ